jgi:phosphotransferase family enzyme
VINVSVEDSGEVISDSDVLAALRATLSRHVSAEIVGVNRRLAAYHSSFRLEEVDVFLADGRTLQLMFKDLSRPLEQAQRVKPAFLIDPQREIDAYAELLCDRQLGTPMCYGTVANARDGQYWLFIDRVEGTRLRELGDFTHWERAAEWLAGLHVEFAGAADELEEHRHLLKYSREHFAIWIDRAVQLVGDDSRTRRSITWLAERYEPVIERLAVLPKTFIHGEFYPSNILIQETAAGAEVCTVDWEMAAVGPGLIDLAALASGWSEVEAKRLTDAYYTAANGSLHTVQPASEFADAFDCCRLHLAVQWLGWASGWQPPPEHVHDWLTSAMNLAEKLSL